MGFRHALSPVLRLRAVLRYPKKGSCIPPSMSPPERAITPPPSEEDALPIGRAALAALNQKFGDGFFMEDGRIYHTESFVASMDVLATDLSSRVRSILMRRVRFEG